MEHLQKLRECNKKTLTARQAFLQFGGTEYNKKLKDLNEKEEFSTLVNWMLNKMPAFQRMKLRHKVNGDLYQTVIRKRRRIITVGKPRIQANCDESINYEWPEEATYETLDVNIIATSAEKADAINQAKTHEQLEYVQETEAQASSQTGGDTQTTEECSTFQEEQPERNDGHTVVTEEEMELINEFLDI